jgi:hypothetical protein
MTSQAFTKQILRNPAIPDEEAAAFLAADEWRAFETHWRPILPARVYTVLSALYDYVRFDKRTWVKKEVCWPSHATLAQKTGISEHTIRRILHRDPAGRFDYTYRYGVYHRVTEDSIERYEAERLALRDEALAQARAKAEATGTTCRQARTKFDEPCAWKVGQLVAIPRALAERLELEALELGDLLGLFIRQVQRTRRFHPELGVWRQSVNTYQVSAILPLPPTLRCDLDRAQYLQQVRAERAELAALSEEAKNGVVPITARPNWPLDCASNLADKTPYDYKLTRDKSFRSTPKGNRPAAIGNDLPGESSQASSHSAADREHDHCDQVERNQDLSNVDRGSTSQDIPPGAPQVPGNAVLSEREMQLVEARAAAGGIIADILTQYGDAEPWRGTETVLAAFVAQGVPASAMPQLAYLARERMNKRTCSAELPPIANRPGYYIGSIVGTQACSGIAAEAKHYHYHVERMRRRDAGQARSQQQKAQARGPQLAQTPAQLFRELAERQRRQDW